MKQKSTKILVILIALILIVGAIMIGVKGLAFELKYQNGKQVEIDLGKEFDIKDMQAITNEVFGKQAVLIEQIEVYKDAANIITTDITEEQKADLVTKINEKYETSLTKDDLTVVEIPHYRGRDLMANYVWPIAISAALIIVYEAIRFRKLGVVKVVAKLIIWPIVIEALYLSVLAITRIPISYYTLPLGIILAVLTLTIITYKNEKKLVEYNRKKNKNSEEDND